MERAEDYGAAVMVDDAHATGVLGDHGRGTTDHFGLHGRVALNIGTLSKAIGVAGGYVAASQMVRDHLIHKSRPFLFSSSHPPAVVAACIAAVDVLEQEPQLMEQLWSNTRHFKSGLRELGFDIGESETPITPGDVRRGAGRDGALGHAPRARASSPRASVSPPSREAGHACERSSARPTRTSNSTERSSRSKRSARVLD